MIYATAAGNLGKDAETRSTQGGDSVTSFSLATESRAKGEKVTTWVDVTIWGKRGSALAPYLRKGGKVTVCGRLSTREYEGKTYIQIDASEVALQGDGGQQRQDTGTPQRQDSGGDYGSGGRPGGGYDDMDSIPFAPEVRA